MGGFQKFLSPESLIHDCPFNQNPTHAILKGGAYGCEEKSQKESQKEKKVSSLL